MAGCRGPQSATPPAQPTVSPSAAPSTPAAAGSSRLDAAVATPSGFPADVPVYPAARLTAGAAFAAAGQRTWGMEWETLDGTDKVEAFYASKFNQGDWTITVSSNSATAFSAAFTRKSDSKVGGLVGANTVNGITTISLSYVSAG